MHVEIEVGRVDARILVGSEKLVDSLLSVTDPNALRSTEASLKLWDGLHHFFDKEKRIFPAGLAPRLARRLIKRGHTAELIYNPPLPKLTAPAHDCLVGVDLRDHQFEGVGEGVKHCRGIFDHATNAGKCLVAGTLVSMADGTHRPIEALRRGDRVVSLDTVSGRFVFSPITATMVNGEKPVFDVTLRNGRTIRCTGNHPFLTGYGAWTQADVLRPGDLVAVPRRVPAAEKPQSRPLHEIRLLAYILAEGTCPRKGPYRFSSASPDVCADFITTAEAFDNTIVRAYPDTRCPGLSDHHLCPVRRHSRRQPSAAEFLDAQGLRGKKSDTKTIPAWVFRLPEAQLAQFLCAFMSCDGHVSRKGVEVALASRVMERQIVDLLLRFGVWGTMRERITSFMTTAWSFASRGADSVDAFMSKVGSMNPVHHRNALAARGTIERGAVNLHDVVPATAADIGYTFTQIRKAGLPRLRHGGNKLTRETVARMSSAFSEDPRLAALGDGDVAWIPVESVTAIGRHPTYDITVKDHHNFIADGVVTHNTECMAAIITSLLTANLTPVLCIVPNINLLHQTAKRFQKRLGKGVKVSRLGDAIREDLTADVVVATQGTLLRALPETKEYDQSAKRYKITRAHDRDLKLFLLGIQSVFVDEAHHVTAKTYQDMMKLCRSATVRLGFTGSVDKRSRRHLDGVRLEADKVKERMHVYEMESYLGPVLHTVRNAEMVAKGYSAKPRAYIITDPKAYGEKPIVPPPPKRDKNGDVIKVNTYNDIFTRALIQDKDFRRTVRRVTRLLIMQEKPPFVFSHSVELLERLKRTFDDCDDPVPCELLFGEDPTARRQSVLERYAKRQDFALLTSSIFDEGADVPEIRALVLAGARKASREFLQRLGRSLRAKDEDNTVVLVDFFPTHAPMLADHAEEREAIMRDEGIPIKYIRDISKLAEVIF